MKTNRLNRTKLRVHKIREQFGETYKTVELPQVARPPICIIPLNCYHCHHYSSSLLSIPYSPYGGMSRSGFTTIFTRQASMLSTPFFRCVIFHSLIPLVHSSSSPFTNSFISKWRVRGHRSFCRPRLDFTFGAHPYF